MLTKSRQEEILGELEAEPLSEEYLRTLEQLDQYPVTPPAARSTEELIALLKPVLSEQHSRTAKQVKRVNQAGPNRLLTVLQLIQPQTMLLSKGFILATVVLLLAGLALTLAVKGDTLKYLANAAPVLGILTAFFEFRAKLSGAGDLEAVCPYSPAQLAVARLLVVLGYDVILCLVATPLVDYGPGQVLWQVIMSWFAPLLMVLGIALTVSLYYGIISGCLIAVVVWFFQLKVDAGELQAWLGLYGDSAVLLDFFRCGIGISLLAFTYLRWNKVAGFVNERCDD